MLPWGWLEAGCAPRLMGASAPAAPIDVYFRKSRRCCCIRIFSPEWSDLLGTIHHRSAVCPLAKWDFGGISKLGVPPSGTSSWNQFCSAATTSEMATSTLDAVARVTISTLPSAAFLPTLTRYGIP